MGRPASMFFWKDRGFATDAGGKRTLLVKGPRTKPNRELAQQRLVSLLQTLGASQSLPAESRHNGKVTLANVIDQFLENCRLRVQAGDMKPNTVDLFYSQYLALLRKALGNVQLARLTGGTILRYRSTLTRRELSQNTIKNHLECLRTTLRWAKTAGYAIPPGVDNIRTPARQRRNKIPTDAEIQILLQIAPVEIRDVLEMLLNIAVRPGDIYALTRDAVDLDSGTLQLSDSKTGPRIVCLTDRAIEILRRRIRSVRKADGLVFTTQRGARWQIKYFAERVRELRQASGLGSHVTAYCLRHYYTTRAFLRGLDLPTVRALRGDRDVKTTLIYEHLTAHLGHLQRAARQAVGQSIAAVSQGNPANRLDEP